MFFLFALILANVHNKKIYPSALIVKYFISISKKKQKNQKEIFLIINN